MTNLNSTQFEQALNRFFTMEEREQVFGDSDAAKIAETARKWAGVASVEAAYRASEPVELTPSHFEEMSAVVDEQIAYDQRFLKIDGREG